IRGSSEDGTILDGQGSSGNVLDVYGSFVHVERLTLQNANRGLRFQGAATEGNVARRLHIRDVRLGIGSRQDQRDFYLCDNVVEGRLVWPQIYTDDNGAHANDDGIHVEGNGHVVCHNQLVGFGDALKVQEDGARADDFYGNEVLSAYDNGIELDTSEGNTRAFRNRFSNTYATLSFQPVFGGPVYAIRNVVVHGADALRSFAAMRAAGTGEPNGILLVAPTFASGLEPPATYRTTMVPQDATLASASTAVDRGVIIANVSDRFTGARPDLGALERDCPLPLFGVRPEGIDETNEPIGCGCPVVTTTSSTSTSTTTLPYVTIRTSALKLTDQPDNHC